MQSKIISVDLAKDVFELAVADHPHRIVKRHRLSRAKFSKFLAQHEPATCCSNAAPALTSGPDRRPMPGTPRSLSPPSMSNPIAGATSQTASIPRPCSKRTAAKASNQSPCAPSTNNSSSSFTACANNGRKPAPLVSMRFVASFASSASPSPRALPMLNVRPVKSSTTKSCRRPSPPPSPSCSRKYKHSCGRRLAYRRAETPATVGEP